MPLIKPTLTAKEIQTLTKTNGLHFVGGVVGLALRVSGEGRASWVLRCNKRDYGLGSYSPKTFPLVDVRKKAQDWRNMILSGGDPRAVAIESFTSATFGELYERWALSRTYKHEESAQREFKRDTKHLFPALKKLDIKAVTRLDLALILAPLYLEHLATAKKIYSRLNQFFEWCASSEYLPTDNRLPTDRGLLFPLLPHKSLWDTSKHQSAIPWEEIPQFFNELIDPKHINTMGGLLLAFVLLTGSRRGNAENARWSQFNDDLTIWTIEAEDMKKGNTNGGHVVPISKQARAVLLRALAIDKKSKYVFHNASGNPLSGNTALKRLKTISEENRANGGTGFYDQAFNKPPTAHGTARASFRTWALEREGGSLNDERIAELCLHHKPKSNLEGAYFRGNALDKRRALLDEWGDYCFSKCSQENVEALFSERV